MSNKNGIDSEARTARLHKGVCHIVPYIKLVKPCMCGGLPQPISTDEMSKTTRVLNQAVKTHGDSFYNKPDEEGGVNREWLIADIIAMAKKDGYDIVVVKRIK